MTRNITPAAREDLLAESSPNALLGFLTIRHRNLIEPIRVVSDPIDYIVGGNHFIGCPFDFQLLTDEDRAPQTQIRLQNVDRRIGETLRTITDRATVQLEARSSADFDLYMTPREEKPGGSAVLYGFRHFDLVDVTVTPIEVTGTLMLRDFTQEPWPGKRATQSRTPGLFR
ncbi:DUF1833 family protein [Pseudogemmobacter faecipullorum]|uniref:DUF1833 family protein n=1 Tax=Pseudogemmobacter faecipullorum TaxID=2755041 RepID=A0ABS8CPJ8_9RHOB|nr:DUF1833 family protein [Pseudogemmobacter faecipullorum]MCB5411322.1 DUF1833 family protein [Pseudogemmobacter faecipullorum]